MRSCALKYERACANFLHASDLVKHFLKVGQTLVFHRAWIFSTHMYTWDTDDADDKITLSMNVSYSATVASSSKHYNNRSNMSGGESKWWTWIHVRDIVQYIHSRIFTSDYSDTEIQVYDGGAKGSEHHGTADHQPAGHDHRSAAEAVDEYTAQRSCTEGRHVVQYLLHSIGHRTTAFDICWVGNVLFKKFRRQIFVKTCCHWPPAYMEASMTDDTQAISL